MLALGPLAFAAPWLLLGLAVLPVLWWLLRVTPPAPRRVRFPALRLLLGLTPRGATPAKTPLCLILMRMALIALIILALAHPLLNPNATLAGNGPLLLAVDNGWTAARHWDERRAAGPPPLSVVRPADARGEADKLVPEPWPEDRKGALDRLAKLGISGAADVVWL